MTVYQEQSLENVRLSPFTLSIIVNAVTTLVTLVILFSLKWMESLENGLQPHSGVTPLLPPANEVWGKIICLQVSVCPQGGACSWGGAWSRGTGACSRGVWSGDGCLLLGGVWSQGGCLVLGGGGCLVETAPPQWPLLQAVHILLEYILVFNENRIASVIVELSQHWHWRLV